MNFNDLELHASVEHEIWSHWMRYMFSTGKMNSDGSWTMPREKVERWTRQMNMPYSELSEEEKESDRKQVLKHIRVGLQSADVYLMVPLGEGKKSPFDIAVVAALWLLVIVALVFLVSLFAMAVSV